jgi:hypothetical protein
MKYMFLTSTCYTFLVLFQLHLCAQAITILYGENVQCTRECITLRSIHLPLKLYLENVVSVMHVGDPPRQNGGVLDNKGNVGHFLCI